MKDEVSVAVRFLTRLIEKSNANVSQGGIEKEQLEVFKERLGELLIARYINHWHPEKPTKGQAYRCIRLNESDRSDAVIDQAATQSGLSYQQLRSILPAELTIWVDPKEVCCRFGEHHGSFCTLASFKNGSGEIFLDQVNLEEIHKKTLELKEKVVQEMSTRKNGRRGFLSGNGSSPNYNKGSRYNNNGYNSHHGHSHHHSPSPAAVSWYQTVSNSVNNNNNNNNSNNNSNQHSNNSNGNNGNHHHNQHNNHSQSSSMDMFTSSSPPNHFSSYNLAKFSPPKYGYGMSSKWNPSYPGPAAIQASKGDKYHWFARHNEIGNSNKATIKA